MLDIQEGFEARLLREAWLKGDSSLNDMLDKV